MSFINDMLVARKQMLCVMSEYRESEQMLKILRGKNPSSHISEIESLEEGIFDLKQAEENAIKKYNDARVDAQSNCGHSEILEMRFEEGDREKFYGDDDFNDHEYLERLDGVPSIRACKICGLAEDGENGFYQHLTEGQGRYVYDGSKTDVYDLVTGPIISSSAFKDVKAGKRDLVDVLK